jgi:hypothetical protein
MLLSNPAKFLLLILMPVVFGSCGSASPPENSQSSTAQRAGGSPPFSTIEPQHYAATIVVEAGGVTDTYFVARDGARRRTDYEYGTPGQYSLISNEREIMLSDAKKIFAEIETVPREQAPPKDPLTEYIRTVGRYTEFEEIGERDGRKIYTARTDGAEASDVEIRIDQATNLPVLHEFYSLADGQRTLAYRMELRGLTLAPDAALFEVPVGFRKVTVQEFLDTLSRAEK